MRWFDLPAAIGRRPPSSSRSVSGSARPGGADSGSPRRRRGACLAARAQERGQVAGIDAAGGVLLAPPGSGQLGEQDAHRHRLVGKDTDVALRAGGSPARLGERAKGAGMIAVGGQRECPQRLDLDDAAGPALAGRGVEQPLQRSASAGTGSLRASSTRAGAG